MSTNRAKCGNCGRWLIENPKSGEWLHASTAKRDCWSDYLWGGYRQTTRAKPLLDTVESVPLPGIAGSSQP